MEKIKLGKSNEEGGQSRGIFERLYKSKIFRALALTASLSFFGQFAVKNEYRWRDTKKSEAAEKVLNLGEVGNNFNMRLVHEGDAYIIHIGQVHSNPTLEGTASHYEGGPKKPLDEVIESQKGIEKIILALSEKHNMHDFYLEDTPSAWGLETIKSIKSELDCHKNDGAKEYFDAVLAIYKKIDDGSSPESLDSIRGPILYYLYSNLKNRIDSLDGAKDADQIPRYRMLSEEIRNNRIIKGDNIYVWGATMKLFGENKINIKLAETEESKDSALKDSFDSSSRIKKGEFSDEQSRYLEEKLKAIGRDAKTINRDKKFVRKWNLNNDLREDGTLEIITPDINKNEQKFYPVIYGIAHDFSNNVGSFDKKHGLNIGLIDIFPK